MGTGNYAHENILAVINDPDEWDVEDTEQNVIEELEKHYKDHKHIYVDTQSGYLKDYPLSRSYPGKYYARICIHTWDNDSVNIQLIWRNGYYSGVNFDYKILTDVWDYTKEHLLEHPSVLKAEKLVREAILRNTTQLEVTARFSSGETLYKEVQKK